MMSATISGRRPLCVGALDEALRFSGAPEIITADPFGSPVAGLTRVRVTTASR
jgi:hypothetical protein